MSSFVEHPADASRVSDISPRMLADIALSTRLESDLRSLDSGVDFTREALRAGSGDNLLRRMKSVSEDFDLPGEYTRLDAMVRPILLHDVRTCLDAWYEILADQIYWCAERSGNPQIPIHHTIFTSFPKGVCDWMEEAAHLLGVIRLIEQRRDEALAAAPPPRLTYPPRLPEGVLRFGHGSLPIALVLGFRHYEVTWAFCFEEVLPVVEPLLRERAHLAMVPRARPARPFDRLAWSTLEYHRRHTPDPTLKQILGWLDDAEEVLMAKCWEPEEAFDLPDISQAAFEARVDAEGLDRVYDEARRELMFCHICEREPYVIIGRDVFFFAWDREVDRLKGHVAALLRAA